MLEVRGTATQVCMSRFVQFYLYPLDSLNCIPPSFNYADSSLFTSTLLCCFRQYYQSFLWLSQPYTKASITYRYHSLYLSHRQRAQSTQYLKTHHHTTCLLRVSLQWHSLPWRFCSWVLQAQLVSLQTLYTW